MEFTFAAIANAKTWFWATYATHPTATIAVITVVALLALRWLFSSGSAGDDMVAAPGLIGINSHASNSSTITDEYTRAHETGGGTVEGRRAIAQKLTNYYYTLATSFYEYGWGQSFHFAPRWADETFAESIKRHEYRLAAALGLKPGMRVLDVGCGVGGPARNIARFSGAHVTGISINEYQIARATAKTAAAGLSTQVEFVAGDFMATPFPDASFDAAYAIEATCHAPDRTRCFSEIFRVLKPGAAFGGYEWVMTDKYDPTDPVHKDIKHGIEVGDGLPDVTGADDVVNALEAAGFIIEEVADLAGEGQITWYDRFNPSYTIEGFKTTPIGIALTSGAVWLGETLRLLPSGTFTMHRHLVTAARTLTAGGRLGLFTPMLYFRTHKPAVGETATKRRGATSSAAAAAATTPSSTRGRSPHSRRK